MGHVTGEILTLHGAVPGVRRDRIRFQNQSDRDVLVEFLRETPRFVSLDACLRGEGNALTVDDATVAGADAAFLAREHGHEVTLFVNPLQVELGAPYWFSMLHELLDRLHQPSYEYEGRAYPIGSFRQRRALREPIKTRCRAILDETARRAVVEELAVRWLGAPVELPSFLETIDRKTLITLRDAGVSIQNHGWSHVDHAHLDAVQSRDEVRRGRDWIERELGVEASIFAVPFGDVLPREVPPPACRAWLMLFWEQPSGVLQPGVFNRTERDFSRPVPAPRSIWDRIRSLLGQR